MKFKSRKKIRVKNSSHTKAKQTPSHPHTPCNNRGSGQQSNRILGIGGPIPKTRWTLWAEQNTVQKEFLVYLENWRLLTAATAEATLLCLQYDVQWYSVTTTA